MFLNVDPDSIVDFHEVKVLGDTLSFITWKEVFSLKLDEVWREVQFHKPGAPIIIEVPGTKDLLPNINKFSPIIFEITTYGPEAAIDIAADRFDIIRVLLNIPSVLGGYTYFRSGPKALSYFLPSPIYVILDNEGRKESIYYTNDNFNYKKEKLPNERISSVKYLLSKFEVEPAVNTSWGYILDIFRLYQKALDISITETAFLTMWQVLENIIGLGEENTKNKEIQSHVSVFVNLDHISTEILDILIDRRNMLVHSGKFTDNGDHLFFILKLITDSVVRSLISLADKYPTLTELKEFRALSSLGITDLDRKKAVIEKIVEGRKKIIKEV